jgi:uncharacterized coiled-coil protein SlyX
MSKKSEKLEAQIAVQAKKVQKLAKVADKATAAYAKANTKLNTLSEKLANL